MAKRVVLEKRSDPPRSAAAAWWVVAATLMVLPLLYDPLARDPFREPKEILFRFFGIAACVVVVFAVTARRPALTSTFLRRSDVILTILIVVWTAITTATSTNRPISLDSLITVICAVSLYLATVCALTLGSGMALFNIALLSTGVNAVLAAMQEFHLWQPFHFGPAFPGHSQTTGLQGNPNDVGVLILIPAVAVTVATIVSTGRRRLIYLAAAVIFLAGLIACATRTALAAYVAAMFAALLLSGRRARPLAVALLLAVIIAASSSTLFIGQNIRKAITAARLRQYNVLLAERLPAFLAAIEMTRDRPLFGLGPGTFKWHYMRYRMALWRKYPAAWIKGSPENFHEVHNDHLQILAETGIPGYLLMAGSFVVLASWGIRKPNDRSPDETSRFARYIAFPIAVAIATVMAAQFPLQLAATRFLFVFFAAFCTRALYAT